MEGRCALGAGHCAQTPRVSVVTICSHHPVAVGVVEGLAEGVEAAKCVKGFRRTSAADALHLLEISGGIIRVGEFGDVARISVSDDPVSIVVASEDVVRLAIDVQEAAGLEDAAARIVAEFLPAFAVGGTG